MLESLLSPFPTLFTVLSPFQYIPHTNPNSYLWHHRAFKTKQTVVVIEGTLMEMANAESKEAILKVSCFTVWLVTRGFNTLVFYELCFPKWFICKEKTLGLLLSGSALLIPRVQNKLLKKPIYTVLSADLQRQFSDLTCTLQDSAPFLGHRFW